MLSSLNIRNFIIIDQAEVSFASGLSVVTGETGAGKSIMLDALGCVLGAKADVSQIKQGAEQASVIATFENVNADLLKEHDIEAEEGELIIRRVIAANGKHKAYVNDQPVSVNMIKALADTLLTLHRQHANSALFSATYYRDMLDSFGGHSKELEAVSSSYSEWKKLHNELVAKREGIERAIKEKDYLEFVLNELEKINPQEGEEEELATKRQQLMHQETLAKQLQAINDLFEHNSPSAVLDKAAGLIAGLPDGMGEAFDQAKESLERAIMESQEAEASIAHCSSNLNLEEESLDVVEERLFELRKLARKHQCSVDELAAKMQQISDDLNAIDKQDTILHDLEKAASVAESAFKTHAKVLSEKRQASVKKLVKALKEALVPLKLAKAEIVISCELQEDMKSATSHGLDEVGMDVSMNPGTPAMPLHKVASGGEMSRLMLALQSLLVDSQSTTTLLLDEVDTGVGGAVADAVGKCLKQLSKQCQVITITHHPQVAAYADEHVRIAKHVKGNSTVTTIEHLDANSRGEEIARMLSGATVTEEARAAARQLMAAES